MAVVMYKKLEFPFVREKIVALGAGDPVLISGSIITARDKAHRYIADKGVLPFDLTDGAIYHCGPVVLFAQGHWQVRAAGPTTSMREEPYMSTVMQRTGIRVIIGKGGMGSRTLDACRRLGCIYIQVAGGAAQVLSECITEIKNVHFLSEFGQAEAMWEMVVQDVPGIVAMDAHGRSIYVDIDRESRTARDRLFTEGFTADSDLAVSS